MNLRGRNCAFVGANNTIASIVARSLNRRSGFLTCILDAATVEQDSEKRKIYAESFSLPLSETSCLLLVNGDENW